MSESTQTTLYKKVMVIDDNDVDRYIAMRNIKKHVFADEVILKESVESALAYLNTLAGTPDEIPSLIFLDIRMPEVDGFGFLERYQHLPEVVKKNCIIIMLSTSLNPDDLEKAKNNRYVSKFLNKPLDSEKLHALRSESIRSYLAA